METKFQTSFIPKKPLPSVGVQGVSMGVPTALRQTQSRSLLLILAMAVFVISLGAAGGMYAWKVVLNNAQENYKVELAKKQALFDRGLIQHLQLATDKIKNAKLLMSNHIAVSNLFEMISKVTSEKVRFISLDIVAPSASTAVNSSANAISSNGAPLKITLTGYGANLPTLAFQQDVLGKLDKYGLTNIIKNPVISDPTVEKNEVVAFSLKADLDPGMIIYMKEDSEENITDTPSSTNQ